MSAHEHTPWRDDLGAYLLDALDAVERARFEAHLADCDRCRAELRWLLPALDVLAASVEQREPPVRVRERIIGGLGSPPSSPGTTGRRRWRLPEPVRRPAVAVAATAVAAVAGLAGGYLLGDAGEGETTTVQAEALVPGTRMDAALVRDGDEWRLELDGMPALSGGDVYQVWLRDGEELAPSVLFVLSDGQSARVALPGMAADADEVLVTREPEGGSDAPTSDPLLAAPVAG